MYTYKGWIFLSENYSSINPTLKKNYSILIFAQRKLLKLNIIIYDYSVKFYTFLI